MASTTPSEDIRPQYERLRWQVFAVTWLAYAGFYLTRKSFWIATVELKKLGWSLGDMASVNGAYGAAYAIGQFVFGMSGDRFGTRRVILTGMMASIVIAVAMGASSTVIALSVLFCLQGLCQATGWAPLTKNMGNFFSQHERGRVMGLWMTNYAVGGAIGSLLAGWAILQFGSWRYAFWVPAAALFVIWLLFLIFQRNRPEDEGLPSIEEYHGIETAVLDADDTAAEEESEAGSWKMISHVLTNRMVLLLAGVYFFIKPTRYLIMAYSPLYLSERLGSNPLEAGILSPLFEWAGPIAVLLGGWASDKYFNTRRMPVCVMALAALAVLLFFFDDFPETKLCLGAGLFGIGFLLYIPDSLVSGTAAIDFGTKQGASTAAGFINGCGSVGQTIGLMLPKLVEQIVGEGEDIWGYIFVGLSISIAIAALLLLPQWNRLPETSGDETA